jgi:hypothetical protein
MMDLRDRYERVVGPDHIMVATVAHNIAVLHVRAGHAARGRAAARRAWEIRSAKLGVDSRRTLDSAGVLAMALSAADDRPGAIALLRRALADARPALGARHPVVLRMRAVLLHFEMADDRIAAQRVADAEELFADVEAFAPVAGTLRTARAAIAVARRAAGDYEDALRHRTVLQIDQCAPGRAASSFCRRATFDVARARLDAGDLGALADARASIDAHASIDTPSLRELSGMHLALAQALERAGRVAEARTHYEAAVRGLVVGGATGHARAEIAWGAARLLDRSPADRDALVRIARAAFVAEDSAADVAALDTWTKEHR